MARRAVKVRVYPTPEQEAVLARTAGVCRFVFNLGLGVKKDAWIEDQLSVSAYDLMAMLPMWKEEFPWLGEVSSVALQQALRNLDRAYVNFFRACKGEGRARFPRFKTRNSRVSFRLVGAAFKVGADAVQIQKVGWVKVANPEYLPSNRVSSVTISRDSAGRWHASLLVDDVVEWPTTSGQKAVGVDLGVKTLAVCHDTDSETVEIANPKSFALHASRLKRYQRQMARRKPQPGQKASNNYKKAKVKAGKVHARIADSRRDAIHKTTTRLAQEYDVICIEDLAVSGMMRSKRMSRSIADASFGEFRRQLEYKTQWFGKHLIVIDRFAPTSKTCSDCGERNGALALSDREWTCTHCGTLHDRDINAAKNILAAGLAVTACGGNARPASSDAGSPSEPGSSPSRALARSAA